MNFQNGQKLTDADTAPIVAIQFSIGGTANSGDTSIAGFIKDGANGMVTYQASHPLTVSTWRPDDVSFTGQS